MPVHARPRPPGYILSQKARNAVQTPSQGWQAYGEAGSFIPEPAPPLTYEQTIADELEAAMTINGCSFGWDNDRWLRIARQIIAAVNAPSNLPHEVRNVAPLNFTEDF